LKLAKKNEAKVRLNLDLTPRAKEMLEELQSRTDAASLVEVVRRALAFYDWLASRKDEGTIVLEKPDGTRETLHFL
jgi:hypothetical protein